MFTGAEICLNRIFGYAIVGLAGKIKIYETIVQPAIVLGSEEYGYEKTRYMGEGNIKDIWTGGRARNMENMN
jgi:hypothetical protein